MSEHAEHYTESNGADKSKKSTNSGDRATGTIIMAKMPQRHQRVCEKCEIDLGHLPEVVKCPAETQRAIAVANVIGVRRVADLVAVGPGSEVSEGMLRNSITLIR